MYDSGVVANRFLELAREHRDTLSPMQLLKLVYIAHGWMLGLYSRPLIKDEIQAWQYGPVIPSLYNRIRRFKSYPVTGVVANDGGQLGWEEDSIVSQVYDVYGKFSGPRLSRITHQPGSPWYIMYKPGSFGKEISNDLIEDYYQRLARNAEKKSQ